MKPKKQAKNVIGLALIIKGAKIDLQGYISYIF